MCFSDYVDYYQHHAPAHERHLNCFSQRGICQCLCFCLQGETVTLWLPVAGVPAKDLLEMEQRGNGNANLQIQQLRGCRRRNWIPMVNGVVNWHLASKLGHWVLWDNYGNFLKYVCKLEVWLLYVDKPSEKVNMTYEDLRWDNSSGYELWFTFKSNYIKTLTWYRSCFS